MLSLALIATPDDIDHITDAIDGALGRVFGWPDVRHLTNGSKSAPVRLRSL